MLEGGAGDTYALSEIGDVTSFSGGLPGYKQVSQGLTELTLQQNE